MSHKWIKVVRVFLNYRSCVSKFCLTEYLGCFHKKSLISARVSTTQTALIYVQPKKASIGENRWRRGEISISVPYHVMETMCRDPRFFLLTRPCAVGDYSAVRILSLWCSCTQVYVYSSFWRGILSLLQRYFSYSPPEGNKTSLSSTSS